MKAIVQCFLSSLSITVGVTLGILSVYLPFRWAGIDLPAVIGKTFLCVGASLP